MRRYRALAYTWCSGFWLGYGDIDDTRQEALLGLLAAIRGYRSDRGTSFRTFARRCVRQRVASAVRDSLRLRQQALNGAAGGDVLELVQAANAGPVGLLEQRDEVRRIVRGFEGLSELERRALRFAINGETYTKTFTGSTSLGNAAQRARRKLRAAA